jgi:hypothetical protein
MSMKAQIHAVQTTTLRELLFHPEAVRLRPLQSQRAFPPLNCGNHVPQLIPFVWLTVVLHQ